MCCNVLWCVLMCYGVLLCVLVYVTFDVVLSVIEHTIDDIGQGVCQIRERGKFREMGWADRKSVV